jgi:hypothetical protein
MEYKIERRKFALMVLKMMPFKSLFTKKKTGREIKVEIHPQAVKRNRKGLKK